MATIRISLPADLADVLVSDHVAIRPFQTRGPADELISLVIEGVNAGASVVTVVIAADAIRKFAARTWARLRQGGEGIVTVTVTVPGAAAPRELKVRADDADGEGKVLDFLIDVLPSHRG